MAEKKKIILEIGSEELEFEVGIHDFNTYVNETTMDNKIAPAKRFLRSTLVGKENAARLDELMNQGLTLEIVGNVIQEFRPKVEITVKK